MPRQARAEGFHPPVQLSFVDSLMRTKQEFKDEVDINYILEHWKKTGHLNHTNPATPIFGDFANADDYLTAQGKLLEADQAFMAMPAEIRDRMGNDPAQFMAFMSDEANIDEAIELGLIPAPPVVNPPGHPAPGRTEPASGENPPVPPNPSPIEGGE